MRACPRALSLHARDPRCVTLRYASKHEMKFVKDAGYDPASPEQKVVFDIIAEFDWNSSPMANLEMALKPEVSTSRPPAARPPARPPARPSLGAARAPVCLCASNPLRSQSALSPLHPLSLSSSLRLSRPQFP